MRPYQINDLERLTGIKAHTIRIWEKRYSLIKPLRTATNRRFYSDDEVKKLLNISTLLSQGHKISKIAAYNDNEVSTLIQEGSKSKADSSQYEAYINNLIKSMITFDEYAFEKIFTDLIDKYGFYTTMIRVIYPFLHKVGVLWSVDESEAAQEHFATAIIRKKLMTATDKLEPVEKSESKFLLFLPEGEWHDTGLLFANYILRSKGHSTIYLGQNLQFSSLEKVVPVVKPDYLLLFYVAARPKEEIDAQILSMAELYKESKILVAGSSYLLGEQKPTLPNIAYITDVAGLHEIIEE